MNVIRKIKESVENAVNIPFYYATAEGLNIELDDADYPCAFAAVAEQGTTTDTNGIIHEQLTLVVTFADLSEFDFDALENEDIIDQCKKRAFAWLTKLKQSDTLQLDSVNNTTRDYLREDVCLNGYSLNITLTEMAGIGACDLPLNF